MAHTKFSNCTACGEAANLTYAYWEQKEEWLCAECEATADEIRKPFTTMACGCTIHHHDYCGRYFHDHGLDIHGAMRDADDRGHDAFHSIRGWAREYLEICGSQICALCGTEGHERLHLTQLHAGPIICICEECFSHMPTLSNLGEWQAIFQRTHGPEYDSPPITTDAEHNFPASGDNWAICEIHLRYD